MFYQDVINDGNYIACIEDNAENTSLFLIHDFIYGSCNASKHVNVFLFDNPSTEHYKKYSYAQDYVHFHDFVSPTNGNSSESVTLEELYYSFWSELKKIKFCSRSVRIVIDSLSSLLIHQSFHELYRELHRLITWKILSSASSVQVLAVIHRDTLEDPHTVINHMKLISKVWIKVEQDFRLKISTKSSNGKLVCKEHKYEIDCCGKIIKKIDVNKVTKAAEDVPQPVSTFKLTLTEDEKKSRENIKLPYTSGLNQTDELNENKKVGKIFYEPDEFDDWDEEEPDDDF